MGPRIAVELLPRSPMVAPIFILAPLLLAIAMGEAACTFYGEHPARSMAETTGGEGMERMFWKNVQMANWVQVERSLATNYSGTTPAGAQDRAAALDQYRGWQVNDFTLGDVRTELNGSTIVVTYTITLNGASRNGASNPAANSASGGPAGPQPLPSSPQHMMTVWQQQKAGWVVIAHSVAP